MVRAVNYSTDQMKHIHSESNERQYTLGSKSIEPLDIKKKNNFKDKVVIALAIAVAAVGITLIAAAIIAFALIIPPLGFSAMTIGLASLGLTGVVFFTAGIGLSIFGITRLSLNKVKPEEIAQNTIKTGYPNIALNCWLSTTLHLVNAAPNDYVQDAARLQRKEGESKEQFKIRQSAAQVILTLLKKSRNGSVIQEEEVSKLLQLLGQVDLPGKNYDPANHQGMWSTVLADFAYILDCKAATFTFENEAIGDPLSHELPQLYRCIDNGGGKTPPMQALHPDGLIEYKNGIPLFPYQFSGNYKEAPQMFTVSINNDRIQLDDHGQDWQCLMKSNDDEEILYELAACSIFSEGDISHFYALVKEMKDGKAVWVEYNDKNVRLLSFEQARQLISEKSRELVYRKVK